MNFGREMEMFSKALLFSAKCVIIFTVKKTAAKNTAVFDESKRKDELMREAKFAATVFGAILVCLSGGLFVAYKAAPDVSTSKLEIEEPLSTTTTAAVETSVSTTTVTTTKVTTSKNITTTTTTTAETTATTVTETTTAEPVVTTVEIETEPVIEEVVPEIPEEIYIEEEVEVTADEPAPVEENSGDGSLPVSDSDYILLCNVVGHEAGSDWIDTVSKATIVEVIMNRVANPEYPDSVYGVLTEPGQFSGSSAYVNLNDYSWEVTESVKAAVRYYFEHPDEFTQGYLTFTGDGHTNYFN